MTAAPDLIVRGRAACEHGAWVEGERALAEADAAAPLDTAHLELLAVAACMLGRDEAHLALLERVHNLHLEAGDLRAAARTAFWIGMQRMVGGEPGVAGGWIGRARRLVEQAQGECVEQGYLLLPLAFRQEAEGELDAAAATAGEAIAIAIAQRFGDRDLFGVAAHMQGHLLVLSGRLDDGLALFDEAMVAVTLGELSPIVSGIVYCGVILGCQAAFDPRRAREWTEALARWCERQPDMVAFSGACRAHRAQLMQLHGAWPDALDEARRASERAARGNQRRAR
jgi:hypothetical protein